VFSGAAYGLGVQYRVRGGREAVAAPLDARAGVEEADRGEDVAGCAAEADVQVGHRPTNISKPSNDEG
jgi:hypothetical protein